MAHAAPEIAVCRRYAAFTGGQDAHVAAQARTAGRRRNNAAGVDEGIDVAFFHGFLVDFLAAGNNDAAHIWMDSTAFKDLGCNGKIFQTAVRAGTDDDLVDGNVSKGANSFGVSWQVGEGNDGGKGC